MLDDIKQMRAPFVAVMRDYFHQSKYLLLTLLTLIFLQTGTTMVAPLFFSGVIDQAIETGHLASMAKGLAFYAILMAISAVLGRVNHFASALTGENLGYVASTTLFKRLTGKTSDFFIQHNSSEVQSAQTQGVEALKVIAFRLVLGIIPAFFSLLFGLFLIGTKINLTILVIVVIYGCFYTYANFWVGRKTRPVLDKHMAELQQNAQFLGNAFTSMEVLRQFSSTDWMIRKFDSRASTILSLIGRLSAIQVKYSSLFGLLLLFQLGTTYYLLLPQVGVTLTVGDLVLFNMVLLQLNSPFQQLGLAIDNLIRSIARFKPYADMWQAPVDPDTGGMKQLTITKGVLAFKDVDFSYANGNGLERLSFEAKRGRVTYIIGESGAGKSTAFKLILRSLEPSSGLISVDGVNISTLSRQNWFLNIGVVPQDTILLNASLKENVVLGRDYDEAHLDHVIEMAAATKFITTLDDGIDTILGERGARLSGGERQRITLARALYGNPAFLLLDEASSALDETTEAAIMKTIRKLTGDITVIAITHRSGMITAADHVVELHKQNAAKL